MIKYFDGTVFNVDTGCVVNTVNCVGVMGAGIALEFKLRYPDMFEDYRKKCDKKEIVTGKIDYYKVDGGPIIANFPTKNHFKFPSKLLWIEKGLHDFVNTYKQHNIKSIAFPKLGSNKGGLNWEEVKALMEKYLASLDIVVYICLDEKKEAAGIEKEMVDRLNTSNIGDLSTIIRLNINQKKALEENIPYGRFWQISTTESIGIKTYERIFKHFYKLAIKEDKNNTEPSQLSFFD